MQYHNAFSAHQYRRRELRRKVRMGNNAGDEIITFKSGLETALDLLLLVFELCAPTATVHFCCRTPCIEIKKIL